VVQAPQQQILVQQEAPVVYLVQQSQPRVVVIQAEAPPVMQTVYVQAAPAAAPVASCFAAPPTTYAAPAPVAYAAPAPVAYAAPAACAAAPVATVPMTVAQPPGPLCRGIAHIGACLTQFGQPHLKTINVPAAGAAPMAAAPVQTVYAAPQQVQYQAVPMTTLPSPQVPSK
jgi:hypothetical protein